MTDNISDDEKNANFRQRIKVGDIITHPEWTNPKDSDALVVYIDNPQDIFVFKSITEYGHDGNLQIRAMACDRGEYAYKAKRKELIKEIENES